MISKNQIKVAKSLKHKKFRSQHSLFLVEGYRNCIELLKSDYTIQQFFYTEESIQSSRNAKLISEFKRSAVECEIVSMSEMSSISDSVTDQGMVAIVHLPGEDETPNLNEMNDVLCLESISDPGNLGTIIRTAAWFGIDSIFLSSDSVDRFNPKVVRSSAGAIFQIPIFVMSDLNDILNKSSEIGFTKIATVPSGGKNIYEYEFPARSIILFGSEANGLSDNLMSKADMIISIPPKGRGESLNLAISCGIVLGVKAVST